MPPKSKAAAADKPAAQKAAQVAIEKALLSADFRDIETLVPYARNAKKHPDEQVATLAGLIEEFGWTNPVLADAKGIIAGHGRILAARKLYAAGRTIKLPNGVEIPPGTVPVIDCTGWSDEKRRFYILADNASAESPWDTELLALEFNELQALNFDMSLAGFDADFVKGVTGKRVHFGDPDEDAPEPPADPVSRPGDVWILGAHRVICGDSTDAANVERLLSGAKPHLLLSDPPYGVDYDPSWRVNAAPRADGRAFSSGKHATGKVENDGRADWRDAWAHFEGDVAFVWCASLHAHEVVASLHAHDFELRSQIIWNKSNFAIGRGDYHWKHEPACYAVRKGGKSHWQGARDQSTVWDIAMMHRTQGKTDDMRTNHSTQKPVECMRRPIENNSKLGDGVYDPFLGSGTTLVAAEMTGRVCFGCEISPAYVDVICARFEKLTRESAVLEGDGRTFAEVMAERCPAGQVSVTVAAPRKRKKA